MFVGKLDRTVFGKPVLEVSLLTCPSSVQWVDGWVGGRGGPAGGEG